MSFDLSPLSFKDQVKKYIKRLLPERILSFRRQYILLKQQQQRLKPRNLLKFVVHFTDHCNLNCKGCDNFSSIADEHYLDISIFEQDCKRISALTNGRIEELQLLGGEPLLHPHSNTLLDIARKYFNIGAINIITNGILLLKQSDDFWQSCKRNNIGITITNYPIKLNYTGIKKKAKQYNVKLVYWGGDEGRKLYRWPLDIQGTHPIHESFENCFKANTCIYLENGKLYTCPTIPCIKHLNKYFNLNFQVSENDYIDIYKAKDINEILDFLCTPVPFCRYCDVAALVDGMDWGISKKDISEWL